MAAPTLKFKGEKKLEEPNWKMIYTPEIFKAINSDENLTLAARMYLLVLIGLGQGFKVPQKLMVQLTGNSERTNDRARKLLSELGYIEIEPRKSITINFDQIYTNLKRQDDAFEEEN